MAADLGAAVEWEPLALARSRLVMAGASAGIPTLDAPYFNITDQEGLQKEATAAMKLGFHGKCAIHPSHVPAINATFTPGTEEVDRASQCSPPASRVFFGFDDTVMRPTFSVLRVVSARTGVLQSGSRRSRAPARCNSAFARERQEFGRLHE